jgi:hypothetical protein
MKISVFLPMFNKKYRSKHMRLPVMWQGGPKWEKASTVPVTINLV